MAKCLCGCGTEVKGSWARGHAARGEGKQGRVVPMPSPAELDGGVILDVGDLIPDDPETQTTALPGPRAPADSSSPPEDAAGSVPADDDDQPPAHASREWQRTPRPGRARAPKLTVAARTDIRAKIEFPLAVFGSIWQARDPLCGGVFVDQVPVTADAFTSIVCDSPDLVRFFTGPGGAFMRWLEVGAALMPVAQVVMAHHVYHSVELVPEGEQAQQPQAGYAA